MFRASSQAVVAGLLGVLAAAERRGRIVGAAALCCCRFVPAERCYKVGNCEKLDERFLWLKMFLRRLEGLDGV